MQQGIKKNEPRTTRPGSRDHAMFLDRRCHRGLINHPQRVAGGRGIKMRSVCTYRMGARNKPQWAIKFTHLIQKHMQVKCQGFRYTVFFMVRGKVVVPLPHLARKSRLNVNLNLLNIKRLRAHLKRRVHQPRVAHQCRKALITQMQPHRGAHFTRSALNNIALVAIDQKRRQALAQRIHLGTREQPGQQQKALGG